MLPPSGGRLVDNIVHFIRALRKSGVPVGTSQVQTAISAVHRAGFSNKVDFYYTLRATLITRPDHLVLFHQVFSMFWRDPEYLERMIHMLSPLLRQDADSQKQDQAAARRAMDALTDPSSTPQNRPEKQEMQADVQASWSDKEILRQMDFEQMSVAEINEASRAIASLSLPVEPLRSRRFRADASGAKPDIRATLAKAMRRGGNIQSIARKSPRYRPPKLVALCDISGSMSVYSRLIMHLLHAINRASDADWAAVNAFTFGTQLTNISRALNLKDVDAALSAIGQQSPDWQGGTRIGQALYRFNRDWSRRVLGQGSVVLLITDGLERGDTALLEVEIARLARSCRKLIWLNPLLRWQDFAPKAAGIKTILPHVDEFLPCHSVDSLTDFANALSAR
ncbi:MAG: VWA domain-containing protein [Alphaproteobacteria bacterium]|nr:VWA domain-containing protein [Alphaproteobacteria bacterium]